jgi:holo-[acyl-carrier protein] synthase
MIVGVGIDIVDVERIASLLEKYGDRFLRRIFTEREVDYCRSKRNPSPHLSARFAAKEAASKALGTGFTDGIRFIDIEVTRDNAKPRIILHNKARTLAEDLGVRRMHVSISHDRIYAAATVILDSSD